MGGKCSMRFFDDCATEDQRREKLIDYGIGIKQKLGRPLKAADFTGEVNKRTIYEYFNKFSNYFEACGSISDRRLRNSNSEQLKTFLLKIKTETSQGCWITHHYSNKKDRLQIKYEGRNQFISRVSFQLWKGAIPIGGLVLHSCDNEKCFNPNHLSLGDHHKNALDMVSRGRQKSGVRTREKGLLKDPYDKEALYEFITTHCEISGKNEYLYTGATTRNGYVKVTINYKCYMLHRLVLANKVGKKYEDIEIACHRLPDGTKPARHDLNPEHLFEGTFSDNTLDTISYSNSFKLSEVSAKEIKLAASVENFSKRGSKKEFDLKWAEKFNVSSEAISDIRRGASWQRA